MIELLDLQQTLHALAIGEGELPRGARYARRKLQCIADRALGRGHEWILVSAAPSDETQAGTGPCGAVQVGEGRAGILEEHHTQPRLDPVELRGRQRMLLRVGADEVRVQSRRFSALPSQSQHRRGDVQAGAVRGRASGG